MWFLREILIRRAERCLSKGDPVPLDLLAKLNEAGVSLADFTKREHLG